jgi:hypothetical protein
MAKNISRSTVGQLRGGGGGDESVVTELKQLCFF